MQPKWQKKIGAHLMRHVRDTTQRGTLTEVKRNIEAGKLLGGIICFECQLIAHKLGICKETGKC